MPAENVARKFKITFAFKNTCGGYLINGQYAPSLEIIKEKGLIYQITWDYFRRNYAAEVECEKRYQQGIKDLPQVIENRSATSKAPKISDRLLAIAEKRNLNSM